MGIFKNSEDPDEMPQIAAFHQCRHFSGIQTNFSGIQTNFFPVASWALETV